VVAALIFLILAERTLAPGGFLELRLRRWPRLHELVGHLALGAAVLRRPQALVPVVGLSLALWLVDASICWLGARALGLQGFIDYPRSVLVLSWAGAGTALPSAPGGIGPFEVMVKSIAMNLGAPAPEAFAYALSMHMLNYVLVTGLGLVFLYRVGLSLSSVQETLGEKRP